MIRERSTAVVPSVLSASATFAPDFPVGVVGLQTGTASGVDETGVAALSTWQSWAAGPQIANGKIIGPPSYGGIVVVTVRATVHPMGNGASKIAGGQVRLRLSFDGGTTYVTSVPQTWAARTDGLSLITTGGANSSMLFSSYGYVTGNGITIDMQRYQSTGGLTDVVYRNAYVTYSTMPLIQ